MIRWWLWLTSIEKETVWWTFSLILLVLSLPSECILLVLSIKILLNVFMLIWLGFPSHEPLVLIIRTLSPTFLPKKEWVAKWLLALAGNVLPYITQIFDSKHVSSSSTYSRKLNGWWYNLSSIILRTSKMNLNNQIYAFTSTVRRVPGDFSKK